MLHRVRLPSMGATMEQGTITAWKVRENARVEAGDLLFELETDKSTYGVESPVSGIVRKILVEAGQTVPVQAVVAIVGELDESIPEDWLVPESAPDRSTDARDAGLGREVSEKPKSRSRGVRISPRARKLAAELGIDISSIAGTGPEGRIETADVKRQAGNRSMLSGRVTPIDRVRQQIMRTVSLSKQEIPHFYAQTSVDMTAALSLRMEAAATGDRLSFSAFFVQAAVAGLQAEPNLRRLYTAEGYRLLATVNVGLAVETPAGVLVGVLRDVDKCSLAELSRRTAALAEEARAGRLAPSGAVDAFLTVSNLGAYRVDTLIPIIHPGQTAILGIGRIAERPAIVQGSVVARSSVSVTLAVDHRVADGADAARFLQAFQDHLENRLTL